jgi:endoglucanase
MTTCTPGHTAVPGRGSSRILIAVTALVAAGCGASPVTPEHRMEPLFSVSSGALAVAPAPASWLEGTVQFQAWLTDGTNPKDYVVRWQVDGGKLNLMADGGSMKVADVDVTGPSWRGEGPYTVTFVARHRRNNRLLAQQQVEYFVRQAAVEPPPAAPESTGALLLSATRLWVDPYSRARRQADEWRTTRPADAAQMDKIAAQPLAVWFGDWSGDVHAAVASMTRTITSAGRLPVYVAYNIPLRDCRSYSAGGATSASAYRSWIRSFTAGLGATRAVVILEPDALGQLSCLTATQRDERLALLRDAVAVLRGQGSAVYIDAGHSHWIAAAEMAARLEQAGVAQADGFALNVSNFQATGDNLNYGASVSSRLSVAGKQFIVDTSRNGLGPTADNQWCNPDGRALGAAPTTATAHPLAVAYLWVKRPGESDGTCNGGPSAGSWWADYALGLAARAPVMVAYGS